MFYLGVLLLVIFAWSTNATEPHFLNTFSEVLDYATNGAPLIVRVNSTFCTQAFPKDLLPYSFTEKMHFASHVPGKIMFSRETPVNGTRLKIASPAIRLIAMQLYADGRTTFDISDTDINSRAVVTSGAMSCSLGLGPGVLMMATSDKGMPFTKFTSLVYALQNGYHVQMFLDLAKCNESVSSNDTLRVNDIQIFGEVIDFRFSSSGDFAFSKQYPFLNDVKKFQRGYLDIKTNTDGSVDVYYYEYDPDSTVQKPRKHFKCSLGDSINYFQAM